MSSSYGVDVPVSHACRVPSSPRYAMAARSQKSSTSAVSAGSSAVGSSMAMILRPSRKKLLMDQR